ncbi:MAG: sodium:phosphate symporter [Planctomycetota bacterium]|nr:MAG: sodium:phosphate symporter [Planctomycetota bacterium]
MNYKRAVYLFSGFTFCLMYVIAGDKLSTEAKNMDYNLIFDMTFKVIGGLGIFLLGMRYMSEGLQAVAGSSLKSLIRLATNNRLMGVVTGFMVTVLVQSSSVTTVMAVGFVNSGIMRLNQAINMILGANIGTTITGWILVLKVGKYGLPILGIAAIFYLYTKSEKMKYIAYSIMGIGMVFFGLALMKAGFKPIKEVPAFEAWFQNFDANTITGVIGCAIAGCILTVIVQSSSATLGITIGLATSGALNFESAAALVLGENIGTTVTALLASIGTTTNARRAAYFHMLFNLIGVTWVIAIFYLYIPFVVSIIHYAYGIEDINAFIILKDGTKEYIHVDKGIALTHTLFNIFNVIVFFPFTLFFANLLTKYVKDKEPKNARYLTHLDFKMYDSSFAALEQSHHEINRMKRHAKDMMDNLIDFINDSDLDEKAKLIFEREDILDKVQAEITNFLIDVLSGMLTFEQAETGKIQLMLADEYESVSDYITQVLKLLLRLKENDLLLSEKQKKALEELHKDISNLFDLINNIDNSTNYQELLIKSNQQGDDITKLARTIRSNHWELLATEKIDPLTATMFNDIIVSYRKIKTHLVTIAEILARVK